MDIEENQCGFVVTLLCMTEEEEWGTRQRTTDAFCVCGMVCGWARVVVGVVLCRLFVVCSW